jgi:hypothetical protein
MGVAVPQHERARSRAKHLEVQRDFSGRPLARGMLEVAVRYFSVMTLTGSLSVGATLLPSSGCVVPAPLEQEADPVNYRPVLISAEPAFGRVTREVGNEIELKVVVDDPNPQDTITARLFRQLQPDQAPQFVAEIPRLESAANPSKPTYRTGTFVAKKLCDFPYGSGTYYAVVADREFIDVRSSAGLTNEANWELECTGL